MSKVSEARRRNADKAEDLALAILNSNGVGLDGQASATLEGLIVDEWHSTDEGHLYWSQMVDRLRAFAAQKREQAADEERPTLRIV